MKPPAALLQSLRASFWFVPALMVAGSMAAAVLLVELDTFQGRQLAEWSPRLFGASAEGSRAMLSAIATSMITVAGVVFSITVVILSQASTQYSPRVLRNFMRDRPTQAVLGVFVGVFAYCLVVLRTVRGGDDASPFIPSVAVLVGMVYAFAAIAMLIFFIHHIAQSIQASSIVERIADDTRGAIDHLFPQELGEPSQEPPPCGVPAVWFALHAPRSGYLVRVDEDRILHEAVRGGRVVRLCAALGDFVAEGTVLLQVSGATPPPDGAAGRLLGAVELGRQRTTEQDAAFGLQQLVDIALKALSPGINDPTTACMCIDRLGALLARLAARRMPTGQRMQAGELRVIAPAPQFGSLLALAFLPVVAHSRGDLQVLARLVDALGVVAHACAWPQRRCDLLPLAHELRGELDGARPAAGRTDVLARLDALDLPRPAPRHARTAPVAS